MSSENLNSGFDILNNSHFMEYCGNQIQDDFKEEESSFLNINSLINESQLTILYAPEEIGNNQANKGNKNTIFSNENKKSPFAAVNVNRLNLSNKEIGISITNQNQVCPSTIGNMNINKVSNLNNYNTNFSTPTSFYFENQLNYSCYQPNYFQYLNATNNLLLPSQTTQYPLNINQTNTSGLYQGVNSTNYMVSHPYATANNSNFVRINPNGYQYPNRIYNNTYNNINYNNLTNTLIRIGHANPLWNSNSPNNNDIYKSQQINSTTKCQSNKRPITDKNGVILQPLLNAPSIYEEDFPNPVKSSSTLLKEAVKKCENKDSKPQFKDFKENLGKLIDNKGKEKIQLPDTNGLHSNNKIFKNKTATKEISEMSPLKIVSNKSDSSKSTNGSYEENPEIDTEEELEAKNKNIVKVINVDFLNSVEDLTSFIRKQKYCRRVQDLIESHPEISETLIFPKIEQDILQLSNHRFANYVISKLLGKLSEKTIKKVYKSVSLKLSN